jgi:very-short-patch-repair endonuclease
VRGAGAGAVRRVLRHADARAANPFESVLRALCIEADLPVEPQAEVVLGQDVIHPDVVCLDRRVVVEGDSWTWHATRKAHTRDCARYNLLTVHGWLVLRFTWEQVMLEPRYVRWVLGQLGARVGRAEVGSGLARPA